MIFNEPVRVLIVDDDPELLEAMRVYLVRTGRFTVRTMSDFDNVVQAAAEFWPQVLVLDLKDTSSDRFLGLDIAQRIRGRGEFERLPIVYFTGSEEQAPQTARRCRGETPNDKAQSAFQRELTIAKGTLSPQQFASKLLEIGTGKLRQC